MPYVNIPESKLTGAIAKQVGSLQDVVTQKVYGVVNDTIQKVRREACPNLSAVNRMQTKVNNITNAVNGVQSKIDRFNSLASTILAVVGALEAALQLVKILPVPQAVPPGIGLPVGFSMVQSDILHLVKEKIKQAGDDADGIVALTQTPKANIDMYKRLLDKVNIVTNGCRLEGVLRQEVARNRISEEQLRDLGIIGADGEYIFSNSGKNLFGDLSFDRQANLYERNKARRRNLQDIKKTTNTDIQGNLITDGTSIGVGSGNLDEVGSDGLNSDGLTSQQQAAKEFDSNASNIENNFLQSLVKLNDSNIPSEVKDSISSLVDLFNSPSSQELQDNLEFNYTDQKGNVYTFEILEDSESPNIAPRRFAVARDASGVIVMKGPKSFSSSTKILLDEIKFRIDNQLS